MMQLCEPYRLVEKDRVGRYAAGQFLVEDQRRFFGFIVRFRCFWFAVKPVGEKSALRISDQVTRRERTAPGYNSCCYKGMGIHESYSRMDIVMNVDAIVARIAEIAIPPA